MGFSTSESSQLSQVPSIITHQHLGITLVDGYDNHSITHPEKSSESDKNPRNSPTIYGSSWL
jgi:hypothetical protein